jgi:hypothetical protein
MSGRIFAVNAGRSWTLDRVPPPWAAPIAYNFDSDRLVGREAMATLVVRELNGGEEGNRVDRVWKRPAKKGWARAVGP